MSGTIRLTCEACVQNIEVQRDAIRVVVHPDNNFGHGICHCPECNVEMHKRLHPMVVEVLIASGVKLVISEAATPGFMEAPVDADPITHNDLIDAHTVFAASDAELYTALTQPTE